ncbi:MAG: hypothetical protein ACHQO8_03385 [Vicinamibacterales bacterium]
MPPRVLIALALLAAIGQTPPPATARVVVQYRVSSEDDTSNTGKITLPLTAGEVKRARLWEAGCHLTAATDGSQPPPDAEQIWGLGAELVVGRDNRPAVRVTTAHVAPNGAVHDETHVLALDDPHPLAMSELSARTDCRYDRVHVTIAAESVRSRSGASGQSPARTGAR